MNSVRSLMLKIVCTTFSTKKKKEIKIDKNSCKNIFHLPYWLHGGQRP